MTDIQSRQLERLIANAVELGCTQAFTTMGKHSGEISYRQAKMTYHKPFVDAVNAGRLTPCRCENGRTGTKFYRVADILSLQIKDSAKAMLEL